MCGVWEDSGIGRSVEPGPGCGVKGGAVEGFNGGI